MKKIMLLIAICGLAVSCSQKEVKKQEIVQEAKVEATDSQEEKMFGSEGSDYGKAGELKTVNFDYDKSELTSNAKSILNTNATWLKNNENVIIQIEGHCDSKGTIEYNLALGEKRALTVKKYLEKLGVVSKKLNTISYGEEKPLDIAETDSAYAKNRRANFVIISK